MTDKSGNKRDWSATAEDRRIERAHVMDFTGWFGLLRGLINHRAATIFQKKPKRGWAARARAKPFQDYLPPDKMEKARLRHPWYRRQKEREAALKIAAE